MMTGLPSLDTMMLVRIEERFKLYSRIDQRILKEDGILNMNVVISRTMNKQKCTLELRRVRQR